MFKNVHTVATTRGRIGFLATAAVVSTVALLSGCQNYNASAQNYTYGEVQREQIVRTGVVTAVVPITIDAGKSSGVGLLAGGALGGVAGNAVGGGSGRAIATVGGAILGALAGNAVENRTNTESGLQITVRLDNGQTVVIAQAADIPITPGQRVQVISGNGPSRVTPM
jgi:outer membrane lipoprotein SlyB